MNTLRDCLLHEAGFDSIKPGPEAMNRIRGAIIARHERQRALWRLASLGAVCSGVLFCLSWGYARMFAATADSNFLGHYEPGSFHEISYFVLRGGTFCLLLGTVILAVYLFRNRVRHYKFEPAIGQR